MSSIAAAGAIGHAGLYSITQPKTRIGLFPSRTPLLQAGRCSSRDKHRCNRIATLVAQEKVGESIPAASNTLSEGHLLGDARDADFDELEDDVMEGLSEEDLKLIDMDGIEDDDDGSGVEGSPMNGTTERLAEDEADELLLMDGLEEEGTGDEQDALGTSHQDGSFTEASFGSLADAGVGVAQDVADRLSEGDMDSRNFALGLAQIASETKGGDITLLHVAPLVYWTSYMIIVTVFSRPQLQAILYKMEKDAKEAWGRELEERKKPGRGVWEVLDYGDVVVHVMTAEERDFYDIEGFYGAAEEVDLPFEAGAMAEKTWTKKF